MPATSEAARMAAFAMAMVLASTNARFVTKMAMVKPTPPSTDTPAIWPQFTPAGKSLKRSLTVSPRGQEDAERLAEQEAAEHADGHGVRNDGERVHARQHHAGVREREQRQDEEVHGDVQAVVQGA